MRRSNKAFTLVELLVAIAILTLLVLFVTRLFDSAAVLITTRNKRMDVDGQARPLLDRIAVDFAQIVKRPDVDYYLKWPGQPQTKDPSTNPTGNDQIAFYSMVPGYYPSRGSQSPVSVVSYRINAQSNVERMGKGLVWNGVSSSNAPMVFLPQTIAGNWPAAINTESDSDYELVGSNVFRFEYFYLLKTGTFSDTPWDTAAGHSTVNGLQDVAAISLSIAAIDPKSRILLSNTQLVILAGRLNDFAPSMGPGALLAQWQTALHSTNDMLRPAISGIRIYQRYFQLAQTLQ